MFSETSAHLVVTYIADAVAQLVCKTLWQHTDSNVSNKQLTTSRRTKRYAIHIICHPARQAARAVTTTAHPVLCHCAFEASQKDSPLIRCTVTASRMSFTKRFALRSFFASSRKEP